MDRKPGPSEWEVGPQARAGRQGRGVCDTDQPLCGGWPDREEVKRVKQDAILDKPEAQGGLWWIGRTVGHGD